MRQEALQSVANHQKMPKQLLQTSLRPILVNLAYYNKLKLPLLHGLARLLSLLATWFNVALGECSPQFSMLPLSVAQTPHPPNFLVSQDHVGHSCCAG